VKNRGVEEGEEGEGGGGVKQTLPKLGKAATRRKRGRGPGEQARPGPEKMPGEDNHGEGGDGRATKRQRETSNPGNQEGRLLWSTLLRHPTPSHRLLSSDQQARLHSGGSLSPSKPGFSSLMKAENSVGAMPRFPR
jgi:hypothetical protein